MFEVLFFGGIIIYLVWAINYNKKNSKEKKEQLNAIQEKGKEYDAIFSEECNHICGLPLAENSKCLVHLCNREIVIEKEGNIFKLQKDKILDMNIKTSKEVQNSISGAVGGAILLGPIGAFLGGTSTEFNRFFIIIYKDKNNTESCISFDIKDDLKKYKEICKYIEEHQSKLVQKKK